MAGSETSIPVSDISRITSLDGLRGAAVSAVVIGHLLPTYVGGGVGVDIFFALSGFLITSILVKEFHSQGTISFGHFYLRRVARLAPALVILLLAASVAISRGHGAYSWREILFTMTYTMNWVRAFGTGDGILLGHTWSLSVEEQFYMLWPVMLWGLLYYKPRLAAAFIIALAALSALWSPILLSNGATIARIYDGFDTRAVELLCGCALAFLPLRSQAAQLLAKLWFVPAILIIAELSVVTAPLVVWGSYGLIGMASAWLVLAAMKKTPLSRILENRALVYLGRISYGIYLWHYMLKNLLEASGIHKLERDALVVVATLSIAAASYHFVEAPILRATRRVSKPQFGAENTNLETKAVLPSG